MKKLHNKFIILGVVFAGLLTATYYSPTLFALGSTYFDDIGDSADNCDIRRAMLTVGQTNLGTAICGADSPQDEPVLLWAGQNNQVNLGPENGANDSTSPMYKASLPFVKARAYFKIPQAEVPLNGSVLDTSKMRAGDRTIEIRGADLCKNSTVNADRQDNVQSGYFYDHPVAYQNREALSTKVTMYKIGDVYKFGRLRALDDASNNCAAGNNKIVVDLKDLDPSTINPVEGVADAWAVNIVVRHIDNTSNTGYDYDPNNASDKNDGLENSFKIVQACDTSRLPNCDRPNGSLMGVGSAGTRAKVGNPFDESEGYVVTTNRGTNGSVVLDANDETRGNGGDPNNISNFWNNYSTLTTKFGADCSVNYQTDGTISDINSAPRYRLAFYDLDFRSAPGPGEPRIRLHDLGTDHEDTSDDYWLVPGNYFPGTTLTDPAGNNGLWQRNVPSYAQSIAPPNRDKQYYIVTFPAVKDHDYQLEILNIFDTRLSQWSVPFDSVYYEKNCKWDAKLKVDWNGQTEVTAGDPATANGDITNTGVENAKLEWRTSVWYDNDNRDEPIGSDSDGGTLPIQPLTPFSAGTILPGNVRNVLNYPVGSVSGSYKYICARVDTRNQTGDLTVVTPDAMTSCIPIVKAPDFKVELGDVRAGGAYRGDDGSCSINLKTSPRTADNYQVIGRASTLSKGSYSQYAVSSPGLIENVGSYNTTYGTGLLSKILLFGGKDWLSPPYLNDGWYRGAANGGTATHCLSDVERSYSPVAAAAAPYLSSDTELSRTGSFNANNGGQTTLNVCSGGCTLTNFSDSRVIHVKKVGSTPGVKKIIINGNVKIAPSSLADPSQLPYFVLILDPGFQVEFAEGVTEFNGIIAQKGGNFITCSGFSTSTTGLSTNKCSSTLAFNGALVTNGVVVPYRTITRFGEVFRLTPETLLSDYYYSHSRPVMTTVDQYELPPRF